MAKSFGGRLAAADTSVLTELAAAADARITGENFPVALRMLPGDVRADLAAVYRYARWVDEIGDSAPGGAPARLALLDEVAADVRALPDAATLTPVAGLAPLVREYRVPLHDLLDLVDANRLDQQRAFYPTFEDLLGYCRLSAAPVGRIVLHRARAATPAAIALSDRVCAALQVLEHCQDVGEDARAGRVYLPQDSLVAHGVRPETLTGTVTTPALRRAVAEQVANSRTLLRNGPPLVKQLRGWARLAVAGYVAGGLATADALAAADHDVLGRDVRPTKTRTLRHAVRLLVQK